jgi:hypothetical protein
MYKFDLKTSVRIKAGLIDEESQIDLSGWQAWVVEREKYEGTNWYTIEWDAPTLDQIPQQYIELFAETDAIESYSIDEESLEPFDNPTTFNEMLDAQDVFFKKCHWYGYGEDGLKIMEILNATKTYRSEEDIWTDYLKENLKLPLKTTFMSYLIRQFPDGAALELVKVLDKWDEELGALVKVKYKGKVVTTALSELSPKEESEALSIYLYWFANK